MSGEIEARREIIRLSAERLLADWDAVDADTKRVAQVLDKRDLSSARFVLLISFAMLSLEMLRYEALVAGGDS